MAYKIIIKEGLVEKVVDVGLGNSEKARNFWLGKGKYVIARRATNNEFIQWSAGLPVGSKRLVA